MHEYTLRSLVFRYHHFPTTGRSPAWPKGPKHASTVQLSNLPFPFMSRYHIPVLGRKTPIFILPVLSQSPTTGKSPLFPNRPRHLSTLQPSHFPFPLLSKYHCPLVKGRVRFLLFRYYSNCQSRVVHRQLPKLLHSSTEQPSNLLFINIKVPEASLDDFCPLIITVVSA